MDLEDFRDGASAPRRSIDEWAHDVRVRVAAGVLVVIAALGWWWHQARQAAPSAPPNAVAHATRSSFVAATTTRTTTARVVVHVAGAVARPGIVTLPFGARVIDAIDAAGGTRRDADADQLDLAARLVDGTRIYVPRRGEAAPSVSTTPVGSDGTTGSTPAGPVNLNTATQTELEALPGIGPSLAQAIVAARERLGGFKRVDDLRQVHGIGDRRLADLRPLVTV